MAIAVRRLCSCLSEAGKASALRRRSQMPAMRLSAVGVTDAVRGCATSQSANW